jgi:malate synthase
VCVEPRQLLDLRIGLPVTTAGVRGNVSVAIRYIEAWLRGLGAVAIDDLMEDAATAEISRSQIWQWIHQDRETAEGTPITRSFVEGLLDDVLAEVRRSADDRFDDAADVFREVALRPEFPAFLTLPAYAKYLD